MQERVRAFEVERFRAIEIAAEAASEPLDAEGALEIRRGAARNIAVAGNKKLLHGIILTSCITSLCSRAGSNFRSRKARPFLARRCAMLTAIATS